jgi:uncharacterized protein with HEPN domain
VSRSDRDRLLDVLEAISAINEHVTRGPISDGLVFDAVRARLIEIGEAIKDIDEDLLMTQPQIPWPNIAGMRDQLAHRYFDTSHAIVSHTVSSDLPELADAVQGILDGLVPTDQTEAPKSGE